MPGLVSCISKSSLCLCGDKNSYNSLKGTTHVSPYHIATSVNQCAKIEEVGRRLSFPKKDLAFHVQPFSPNITSRRPQHIISLQATQNDGRIKAFVSNCDMGRRLSTTKTVVLHIQPFPANITPRSSQHHPLKAVQNDGRRRRKVLDLQALYQQEGGGDASDSTQSNKQTAYGGLLGRVVAFTTPLQYASRFDKLLREESAHPLWCPTIVTEQTEQTRQELHDYMGRCDPKGESQVHGVAFTSRAGIRAVSEVLNGRQLPWEARDPNDGGLDSYPFVVAALGKDAELLRELNVISDYPRLSMVVPAISTPQALVEALGQGNGRKIFCPVPLVEGLEEPPVVPQFLEELRGHGWDPVRVNSYVTRWLGWDCAKPLLVVDQVVQFGSIDALVFTSTAEIEGLLKSCRRLGLDGVQALQRRSRRFLVACHGPVTALGAQRLGVEVDVIGKEFQSFAGVIKALGAEFSDAAQN